MKELVVISGKGGTGKTSMVASFVALAKSVVVADCDVDASDLHIVLDPDIKERHDYFQGHHAKTDADQCSGCGACKEVCRFEAVHADPASHGKYHIDPMSCEGCGACLLVCPQNAISLTPVLAGEWYVSRTRFGEMVHARLKPGGHNSGKLVSQVRQKANAIAKSQDSQFVIIDGSPGIGCPVIASIARASLALVVTEPTPSGMHDMQRVIAVTRHFKVPTLVCVNRWDLNETQTESIERFASENGVTPAGRVREDGVFNAAQRQRRTVMEMGDNPAAADIKNVWAVIVATLNNSKEKSI